jgi:predicted phosphodiesterase
MRPLLITLMLVCVGMAPDATAGRLRTAASDKPVQSGKCNDVPAHPFNMILGRPTSNSVTISILCYADTQGCVVYGTQSGRLTSGTPVRLFGKGQPVEIVLSSLQADTQYFYRFHSDQADSVESSFHTARPPGSTFVFTVTADSHLDENTDCALYQRTLANALADAPDFHIDLGDTFMTGKYASRAEAARQYLTQRYYFGQLCASAPLFLVLGNHDGETWHDRDNDTNSLAVWSCLMRKHYFPNPVPDDLYTGNSTDQPQTGLLQDYYSWQWGDALFLVLDPYWFTPRPPAGSDNWNATLGQEQYQWLKRTLETSRARFKFVFIHNLVGGANAQGRGGVEAAPFYEWGGHNADGSDGFAQNRPGWPAPIHQLLVQNKVDIVFHGHDHFFAKQDLDGIVYQEVPQPGLPGSGNVPRSAAEYGYVGGVLLGSPGYMRITVSPDKITADLVYSCLPADSTTGRENRQTVYSYTISH